MRRGSGVGGMEQKPVTTLLIVLLQYRVPEKQGWAVPAPGETGLQLILLTKFNCLLLLLNLGGPSADSASAAGCSPSTKRAPSVWLLPDWSFCSPPSPHLRHASQYSAANFWKRGVHHMQINVVNWQLPPAVICH